MRPKRSQITRRCRLRRHASYQDRIRWPARLHDPESGPFEDLWDADRAARRPWMPPTAISLGHRPAAGTSRERPQMPATRARRRSVESLELGEILVRETRLTPEQLEQARLRQTESHERLADVLIEEGFLNATKSCMRSASARPRGRDPQIDRRGDRRDAARRACRSRSRNSTIESFPSAGCRKVCFASPWQTRSRSHRSMISIYSSMARRSRSCWRVSR